MLSVNGRVGSSRWNGHGMSECIYPNGWTKWWGKPANKNATLYKLLAPKWKSCSFQFASKDVSAAQTWNTLSLFLISQRVPEWKSEATAYWCLAARLAIKTYFHVDGCQMWAPKTCTWFAALVPLNLGWPKLPFTLRKWNKELGSINSLNYWVGDQRAVGWEHLL